MKNIKWALWSLALIVFACDSNDKTFETAGGIKVQYIKTGEGGSPAHGEIIVMNMDYSDENGNIMFETTGGPVAIKFETLQWKQQGLLYEVFSMLKSGDSVSFQIPAEDLYGITFNAPVPDSISSESLISFNCALVEITTMEAFNSKRGNEQNRIDAEIIETYLSENQIEAQTMPSGLRYVITQEGTGRNAIAGDNVLVHYNGTLLDGTKFDSSYDRGEPFPFPLGQGRVIAGWDEGIALLNTGAKATLYIPSSLAYGSRSAGAQIGSNSILKFEVELVEIQ